MIRQDFKLLEIKYTSEFLKIKIQKPTHHTYNNLNNKLHESSTLYSSGISDKYIF